MREVIWHECRGCGREWPFPKGHDPLYQRDFRCQVCVHAEWSKLQREKQK
jgi:hypothetical protein